MSCLHALLQEEAGAFDVHAARLEQLTTAFPGQLDSVLDEMLRRTPCEQQAGGSAPVLQLARSLQGFLGWSRLLCLSDSSL